LVRNQIAKIEVVEDRIYNLIINLEKELKHAQGLPASKHNLDQSSKLEMQLDSLDKKSEYFGDEITG